MKKEEYIILLIALIFIMALFSFYNGVSLFIFSIIAGVILLIFISVLCLSYNKKSKLNKYGRGEIYIFSCCYVNDNIKFDKLYSILSKEENHDINGTFKNTELFIEKLLKQKIVIQLNGKESLKEIVSNINLLLKNIEIDIEIKEETILKKDNHFIKNRRLNKFPTFIHDLNTITKIIRNSEYELVQIYPIYKNERKKVHFYITLVPIKKLLDLNEIGYMG